MIYIGNGIYSDASPNEYLQHYGVLGMKWGVRKARFHEKNLYRHNRANGMSRGEAKDLYKKRMANVKDFANKNRYTSVKARDIQNKSREDARNAISNYDKKVRNQKIRKGIALGLAGAAAAGGIYALKKHRSARKNIALSGDEMAKKFYKDAQIKNKLKDNKFDRDYLKTHSTKSMYKKSGYRDGKMKTWYGRDKLSYEMVKNTRIHDVKDLLNMRKERNSADANAKAFYNNAKKAANLRNKAAAISGVAGATAVGLGAYNSYKKKKDLQHDCMNGIDNYLCHYGVLGMKWGVHKAKSHLKNIYYGRLSKSKSIGDIRSAKLKYREDMKNIREFAKQNKKNKDVKVSDIEKAARDKAKSHFDDDYDVIDRKIKTRRAIDNALTGAAAGLGAASMIYQGKQNRKYEQSHGLTSHMPGSHKYVLDNSRGTKAADALGYASIGLLGASVIPQSSRNKYRRMMNEKFHE